MRSLQWYKRGAAYGYLKNNEVTGDFHHIISHNKPGKTGNNPKKIKKIRYITSQID